jgi:hypothetical protein
MARVGFSTEVKKALYYTFWVLTKCPSLQGLVWSELIRYNYRQPEQCAPDGSTMALAFPPRVVAWSEASL